jgi:hypothetical protein
MSYSETLGSGWYTYYLKISAENYGYASVLNASIFVIETKR